MPSPSIYSDLTELLSDELLLRILSQVPNSSLTLISLVSHRFLRLTGKLRDRLTLFDWSFLSHIPSRFPDLSYLDLVPATFLPPPALASPVLLSHSNFSLPLPPDAAVIGEFTFLEREEVDAGLKVVADAFPGLRRLSFVAISSEDTLCTVGEKCRTLQELEMHKCTDFSLGPVSVFANLQVLRLVGSVEGVYGGLGVSDIGLTILARGCKRLVKLELVGCEGSFDGISAIGRCCFMLEELTFSQHRMDAGWMAGLSYCGNLKTLKFTGCRRIDLDPGPEEHLGSCPTIESLHFQRCHLRDKRSLSALFTICDGVKDVVFHDCWGFDDDMFSATSSCRFVPLLLFLWYCSRLFSGVSPTV